jgi:hypothetical protein
LRGDIDDEDIEDKGIVGEDIGGIISGKSKPGGETSGTGRPCDQA